MTVIKLKFLFIAPHCAVFCLIISYTGSDKILEEKKKGNLCRTRDKTNKKICRLIKKTNKIKKKDE